MSEGFSPGIKRNFLDPPISLNFDRGDRCLVCRGHSIHGDQRHSVESDFHGRVNGICLECGQTYVWVGKEG